MNLKLSDLAEMDADERERACNQLIRTAARPEQRTALQPSTHRIKFDGIAKALSQLRAGDNA